ncbi:MAG: protein translocase subunit SecD [Dehalococcoidia bacterium]
MSKRARLVPLLAILLVALVGLYVVWPAEPGTVLPSRIALPGGKAITIPWPSGKGVHIGGFERREMRLGLDLQGGTRLLLRADVPSDFEGNVSDALEGTIRVLRKRVDASGLSEAEITKQGEANISVQLPGLTPEKARSLLGRTAQLRFCEPATSQADAQSVGACDEQGNWKQATGVIDGKTLPLKGSYLKPNAYVGFDQAGLPLVGFEFQSDGGELFKQITTRLLGNRVAIYLDNEELSAPVVQGVISDRGQITGLSVDRARELVIQLNAGALPLELTVLQEQNVAATLGANSVQRSILAGQIGLLLVMLFMVLYYRFPGVIAAIALLVYTILSLAVFKLVPVTLTLAGIGAFVLSIGMAVDANVLIFERMKEELRAGRSYSTAIQAGFFRAWPSIRDSNASTLITCAILYVLGGGVQVPFIGTFDAPLVQGFALTLAVGVLVSLFTAITVTRVLLRLFVNTSVSRKREWFVPTDEITASADAAAQEGAQA